VLRILIIKESHANMQLAVAVLEKAGHTAAKGLTLDRTKCPGHDPMDLQLPDMESVVQRVRGGDVP